jgi:hypothetical protein
MRSGTGRPGLRGLIRKGVPDVVAMRISGHESRSVFDRYNIVSESDIEDALGRVTLGHSSATKPSRTKVVKHCTSTLREWRNWQTRWT